MAAVPTEAVSVDDDGPTALLLGGEYRPLTSELAK
jgi:hypothetical protein